MIYLVTQTDFSQQRKSLISSIKVSIESLTPKGDDSIKKRLILILARKILIVQIFPKTVFKNDSARLSKWCLSVTTGFTSIMKVTISNIQLDKKMVFRFQSADILHQNPDSTVRKSISLFLTYVVIQSQSSQ